MRTPKTAEVIQKYMRLAPIAVLVLVAAVSSSLFVAQRAQAGADDKEVKSVVLTAFNTSASFGKVEHIAGNTKTPPSENLSAALNVNDVEAAREHARIRMSSIFASNCTVCALMAKGVDEGLTAEGKGTYRIVASGMRDVDWRQITINGDTASVTIAATTWIKTISRNEFGEIEVQTPEEGRVQIFTLAKSEGHWQITNVVLDQISTGDLQINKRSASAPAGDNIPAKPNVSPQGGNKVTAQQ